MKNQISNLQAQILDTIQKSIQERGYPPTVREIGEAVGITSSSVVHGHLHKLEALGFIEHEQGHRRAISLPSSRTEGISHGIRTVPVLRSDTRNVESFQADEAVEHIQVILSCEESLFAFRMPDESMFDAGILPHDLIVIRRGVQPQDDVLTAVQLNGALTLRRWKLRRGTVWLYTENPEFTPVRAEGIPVWGIAALLQRRL